MEKLTTLAGWHWVEPLAIGVDISDRESHWYGWDGAGEVRSGVFATTREGVEEVFKGAGRRVRVVFEAGTHANWLHWQLRELGHESYVLDPRVLCGERTGRRKSDRTDARDLAVWGARLGRPGERVPVIQPRTREEQLLLAKVRSRDTLVRSRTAVVTSLRGQVKALGERLGPHSSESLHRFVEGEVSEEVAKAVAPLTKQVAYANECVKEADEEIKGLVRMYGADAERLLQVNGVGEVVVAAYMTVIGDPHRFKRSRDVGAYLGLTPRRWQSGKADPQLGISKAGDKLVRRLLVQSAQYILGHYGKDCALRRWGLKLAGEGNKARKRKAVVALARKLAVLLHRLWVSGAAYDPWYGQERPEEAATTV